jgi:hypothetical protein
MTEKPMRAGHPLVLPGGFAMGQTYYVLADGCRVCLQWHQKPQHRGSTELGLWAQPENLPSNPSDGPLPGCIRFPSEDISRLALQGTAELIQHVGAIHL